jgi:hypothetical protein
LLTKKHNKKAGIIDGMFVGMFVGMIVDIVFGGICFVVG